MIYRVLFAVLIAGTLVFIVLAYLATKTLLAPLIVLILSIVMGVRFALAIHRKKNTVYIQHVRRR